MFGFYIALAFLAGAFTTGITLLGAMLLFTWWMLREAEFEADFGDIADPARYAP